MDWDGYNNMLDDFPKPGAAPNWKMTGSLVLLAISMIKAHAQAVEALTSCRRQPCTPGTHMSEKDMDNLRKHINFLSQNIEYTFNQLGYGKSK